MQAAAEFYELAEIMGEKSQKLKLNILIFNDKSKAKLGLRGKFQIWRSKR